MFESVELTFFRKVVLVIACVMLPGFIYGFLLLLGQDRSQFDVRGEVSRIVFLQDVEGAAHAVFVNRPGEFKKCVSERGREFCLRLLSEKIAGSLAGEFGPVPNATDGASDANQRSPNFIGHLRYVVAGVMGIVLALVCAGVGAAVVLRPNARLTGPQRPAQE
jgi:hypothetical protein